MTTENSVGKKWLKRGVYSVAGVVLFLYAFVWFGNHTDDILRWKVDRDSRAYSAMLQAERDQLKAMEMADTYGSTTPEGTAELILAALEKNDLVLASKYYYVLDQEKALASFKKQEAEKGNLNIAISFFKDILGGKKKCNEDGDGCSLSYEYLREQDEYIQLPGADKPFLFEKGSKSTKSHSFELNKYKNIWKAEF